MDGRLGSREFVVAVLGLWACAACQGTVTARPAAPQEAVAPAGRPDPAPAPELVAEAPTPARPTVYRALPIVRPLSHRWQSWLGLHAIDHTLTPHPVTSLTRDMTPLMVADLDGDGLSEVLVTTLSGGWQVIEADGSAWWSGNSVAPIDAAYPCDLDGDGRLGVILTTSRLLVVLHNAGDSAFEEQSIPIHRETRIHVACGDVDGDGDVDIVYSSYRRFEQEETGEVGHIGTLLGGPGLTFSPGPFSAEPERIGTPREVLALHLEDVDGDGVLDLLSVNRWLSGPAPGVDFIALQRGRGDGGFDWVSRSPLSGTRDSVWARLDTDLSGDGLVDLLICSTSGCGRRLQTRVGLFGASASVASFGPPTGWPRDRRPLDAPPPPFALHPVDFDRDGVVDLIAPTGRGEVAWLRGTGRGFGAPRVLARSIGTAQLVGVDSTRPAVWVVTREGSGPDPPRPCGGRAACEGGVCVFGVCQACYVDTDCVGGVCLKGTCRR